jgi:hypothetical protein
MIDNNSLHNIIIIQRYYRIYKINKIIKKIIKYKLFIENDFDKYKKIMMNKELINDVNILMKWLKNCSYRNYMNNTKIFLTAIMIYNFPDGLLGNIKERHPIDTILLDNINALVNSLFDIKIYSDVIKLINHTTVFEELFNEWKNIDRNRTIQNIIISYKHRQDHIKHINDTNTSDDSEIILKLKQECDIMLKTISTIDSTYNIDYVKNNYNEIYDTINITTHKIENKIKSNFQKAYIDYLVYEFSNNNDLDIIKKLILETNDRIILCVPNSIKNSIKNKLNNYDYNNLLLENEWSNDLVNYFKFIIDTIFCCDKKNLFDIDIIKILYKMVGNNFHHNIPYILVNINMLIDIIIPHLLNN